MMQKCRIAHPHALRQESLPMVRVFLKGLILVTAKKELRHFKRPQLFHLNTEMVFKAKFLQCILVVAMHRSSSVF